jgi:ornithine cyclodeaminase
VEAKEMSKIFDLSQIKKALKKLDPVRDIEQGFVAYSRGQAVVPPVGELVFKDPPGEVHIKYGYLMADDYYVIKIASGFYESRESKRYKSDGLMLLFRQRTGELACVLLDECYLTHVRTAAAGAVVAKCLAPKNVHRIGIFGAGVQGRMQLEYLRPIVSCRDVTVWGLNKKELDDYKRDMEPQGFNVRTTLNGGDVTESCNLIVTATPSTSPLISGDQIQKGVHITAMGSDTPEKNELDPLILQKADLVVADSISQCLIRGEIHHAIKTGLLREDRLVELGNVILKKELQRSSDDQITVADLTGVAVQDIQISKAVYNALVQAKL